MDHMASSSNDWPGRPCRVEGSVIPRYEDPDVILARLIAPSPEELDSKVESIPKDNQTGAFGNFASLDRIWLPYIGSETDGFVETEDSILSADLNMTADKNQNIIADDDAEDEQDDGMLSLALFRDSFDSLKSELSASRKLSVQRRTDEDTDTFFDAAEEIFKQQRMPADESTVVLTELFSNNEYSYGTPKSFYKSAIAKEYYRHTNKLKKHIGKLLRSGKYANQDSQNSSNKSSGEPALPSKRLNPNMLMPPLPGQVTSEYRYYS